VAEDRRPLRVDARLELHIDQTQKARPYPASACAGPQPGRACKKGIWSPELHAGREGGDGAEGTGDRHILRRSRQSVHNLTKKLTRPANEPEATALVSDVQRLLRPPESISGRPTQLPPGQAAYIAWRILWVDV
jgi:hypothetical protein